MKKKVIALLLSLVLASGSLGCVQPLAAETTEQEAEVVQESETADQEDELLQEDEPAEEADVENAVEDISEPVEEEEPVPGNEEHASETAGKTKSQGPAQLYRRPDDELFRHGTQQGGRNPETEL